MSVDAALLIRYLNPVAEQSGLTFKKTVALHLIEKNRLNFNFMPELFSAV